MEYRYIVVWQATSGGDLNKDIKKADIKSLKYFCSRLEPQDNPRLFV
jgi:hypothetical protein